MKIEFRPGRFETDEMRGESREYMQKCFLYMAEALVNCNREYLRSHPRFPSVYTSGVRYVREQGTEIWQAIPEIVRTGGGDCEDLACWRVAELREMGINAKPFLKWKRYNGGFTLYHVLVQIGEGATARMDDPSRRLGMGD